MHAELSGRDIATRGGPLERRLGKGPVDDRIPGGLQGRVVDTGTGANGCGFHGARCPELLGVRHQVIQRSLHPGVRNLRAVTELDEPVARVPQVVLRLLERLRGDRGKLLVGRGLERVPHQHHQRAEQEIARDRDGIVALARGGGRQRRAVGDLDQRVVAKLRLVAKVSQQVFGCLAVVAQGRHALVEQARLADQVEAVVGQRQILFQNRAVAAPFGVALAQNQRVVRQVQKVLFMGCHYMCPTSSGMS